MEKLRESLICDEKRDRDRDAAGGTAESHGERIRGARGLLHKEVKSLCGAVRALWIKQWLIRPTRWRWKEAFSAL